MAHISNRHQATKKVMEDGPKNTKSKVASRNGQIMSVASRDVISTFPQNTVKKAASLMRDHDVRRLPILHPGTKSLEGLVTAVDILDYLGGGPKYNIIAKDYGGNFLSAINGPISKIMRESQYLPKSARIEDAINIILDKRSSCIPVVESEADLNVVGLVTERDVLPPDEDDLGIAVSQVMNSKPMTTTPGTMMGDVAKIMVRNRIRRLPVISEGELAGIVTVFDVLGYLEEGEYKGVFAEENLSTRVEEIMESNVITVKSDDDLGQVIKLVRDIGYGGFPVTEGEKLIGIITTTDMLAWIYRQG